MLFFGGRRRRRGGSCGIGEMGFLPCVLEAGGRRFVGRDVGGVMDPGVPGGGDEAGVFGSFAVDDPAAGFLRSFFAFEIAIVEGVASDEASVEEGLQKGDGGSHGGSVAEKIVFLTGFSATKRRCVCCARRQE